MKNLLKWILWIVALAPVMLVASLLIAFYGDEAADEFITTVDAFFNACLSG